MFYSLWHLAHLDLPMTILADQDLTKYLPPHDFVHHFRKVYRPVGEEESEMQMAYALQTGGAAWHIQHYRW